MFPQLTPIFASLEKRKAKYLVIGGIAVMHYGVNRMTKDLDLLIEPTTENATKILEALRDAELGTADLIDASGLLEKRITIFQDRIRVDVLTGVAGVDFLNAWNDRETVDFHGQPIQFISKEHLIASKRACGRPSDLEDLRRLES